ncbi:hypothetical protein MJT46_010833 [Ovis ammon polii x Ovis aries]|nr:hypothetical protein MJT46_010833 [Ovis ammon polii x Ovis aries]
MSRAPHLSVHLSISPKPRFGCYSAPLLKVQASPAVLDFGECVYLAKRTLTNATIYQPISYGAYSAFTAATLCWPSAQTLSSQLQWPPWPQAAPGDRKLDSSKVSKSGEGSSRASSVQRPRSDRRPPQEKLSPAPAVGLNPTLSP